MNSFFIFLFLFYSQKRSNAMLEHNAASQANEALKRGDCLKNTKNNLFTRFSFFRKLTDVMRSTKYKQEITGLKAAVPSQRKRRDIVVVSVKTNPWSSVISKQSDATPHTTDYSQGHRRLIKRSKRNNYLHKRMEN